MTTGLAVQLLYLPSFTPQLFTLGSAAGLKMPFPPSLLTDHSRPDMGIAFSKKPPRLAHKCVL